MINGYRAICAYSGCWVPTQASVDHFLPKSVRPDLAYEWSNYRLCSDKINSYKADSTDVADPFHVLGGWFCLDFDTFYVKPGHGLRPSVSRLVRSTIRVLRLNNDDALVNLRFEVVEDYALGNLTFRFLERRYPFIAHELRRQGLIDSIRQTSPGE